MNWNLSNFRQPHLLFALAALLILVVGSTLVIRDLGNLIDQRQHEIETTALAIADLIPLERIQTSLRSKDAKSPDKQLLRESLLQVRLQLNISGHLHVLRTDGEDLRILASTDPDRSLGDQFSLSNAGQERLMEGLMYSSGLQSRGGEYWISSLVPLLVQAGTSEGMLAHESMETSLFYRVLSLALQYFILAAAMLALFLVALFYFRARDRQHIFKFNECFESLYQSIQQPIITINKKATVVSANPSALRLLDSHIDDVEGSDLFSGANRFHLVILEAQSSELMKKLREGQAFQFKAKLINIADEARYLEAKVEPLISGDAFVFINDITQAVFERQMPGLEHLKLDTDSSFYDEVTGLPNFNYLRSVLDTQWSMISTTSASLMLVDLDDFQKVNEQFGPESGDKLLKEFAGFLKKYFRESDNVTHYFEDKFFVLLPRTDLANAERIANNLLQTAKKNNNDRALFSIGIATLEEAEGAQDWIARTAAALDTAKNQGKGRVEVQRANELEIIH